MGIPTFSWNDSWNDGTSDVPLWGEGRTLLLPYGIHDWGEDEGESVVLKVARRFSSYQPWRIGEWYMYGWTFQPASEFEQRS